MSKLQIKPYLDIRQLGSTLRIGQVPPSGIEIVDAPEFLVDLIEILSSPTGHDAAAAQLASESGIAPEVAADLIDQLIAAGVVGPPIPDSGRYARHLLYYDMVGIESDDAQQTLSGAVVGIVGTGGIGSNVATLLAAAGVGHLVITDGDHIEESNLTRQFLYTETSVGRNKVEVAAERLRQINSAVKVTAVAEGATREMFDEHLSGCDLVVLSADSPDELHEWIDDAARRHGFGYLAAGYIESVGSVGPLVLPGVTACYECFREVGELEQYLENGQRPGPNLNQRFQAGSYGPLNVIVAAMASNEVLRCLLGANCRSAGTRLLIDSRSYQLHNESFPRRPDCPACGSVQPSHEWATAADGAELEDLYETDRAEASANSVVLDDLIAKCASVRPGMKVLDYGCGNGEQVLMAASRGAEVVACDISERMLELLQERLPADIAARVTTKATTQPPQAVSAFDLILCNNVLDHIADIGPVLDSFSMAVKDTGTVVISVPHPVKDGASWSRRNFRGRWQYEDIRLSEYFAEGPVTKHREDSSGDLAMESMMTYHRTIETYFAEFCKAGFQVTGLYEPQPSSAAAITYPEIWEKASRVPYFLVFTLRPSSGAVR
jgi:bacteriocin biosynthesis cyclodehydratase domain-containing protein